MGDVVHALPVVADIRRARADVVVDWLVEPAFAALPQLHPGVSTVHALPWRRWRQRLLQRDTRAAMAELRAALRAARYDAVLDLQGLLKSALWARQAGAPVAGYDRASAREPAAAWCYRWRAAVPRTLHAVDRCRRLAAAHLGLPSPQSPPDFGIAPPRLQWRPARDRPYAVLIPNASRPEKLWPEKHWVAVGQRFATLGWTPLVAWGSDAEQTLAERIAAGCDGDVPPFLKVGEMAAVLAAARHVVGLDTGFSHLAAALGRPTIGIYCDHDPGLAGIVGPGRVASVGGKGQVPSRAAVLDLLEQQLAT